MINKNLAEADFGNQNFLQENLFFRFSKGETGTSEDDCKHLLRAEALDPNEKLNSIYLQNYPDYIKDTNYEILVADVIEFNRQVEAEEMFQSRTGVNRTYYKMIMSFKGKLPTKLVRDLVIKYLQRQFPYGIALAVVHQNTNNTHINIHLQARDVTGYKLSLPYQTYRNLDKTWGEIVAQEFGVEILERHLQKKAEMHQYKIAHMIAKADGSMVEKPKRATYDKEKFKEYRMRKAEAEVEKFRAS